MKVVISMGGSILASPSPNIELIKDFAKLLVSQKAEGHNIKVVVGGGDLAREYISAAGELGADWKLKDQAGIAATRMNAMLLCAALGEHAWEEVPQDTEIDCESRKILVMGGVRPGQTTDAVAAELAVRCNADLLLIGTNVDGVHDNDPKKDPNAKKIASMNTSELIGIVGEAHTPGMKAVIDPVAAVKIHESGIKAIVVDGRNLDNIKNAIEGKEHGGTDIVPA
jgi:uridylate kinase